MLAKPGNGASIQLFYTTEAQSARMEDFMARANALGKLSEIYVLPVKIRGKEGFRVLYGAYSEHHGGTRRYEAVTSALQGCIRANAIYAGRRSNRA